MIQYVLACLYLVIEIECDEYVLLPYNGVYVATLLL